MPPLKTLLLIFSFVSATPLLGQYHVNRQAYQAPYVRGEPRPRRMSFPKVLSRTTVLQAYERMVATSKNEQWRTYLLTIRQHAPNLVWDISLQRAAIKVLTGKGPGPNNRNPLRGDELRKVFSELFVKGGLHERLNLEIGEGRHFVNNHVRYLKDRQCFARQRHVQRAIDQFLIDHGALPRGGYKELERSLVDGGYVDDTKLFHCIVGLPFDYRKNEVHHNLYCSRHGWYGDWHSGPSPYSPEKARTIFEKNAVVWAFLREYSCEIRRRAFLRTIEQKSKGRVTLERALAIADSLENGENRTIFTCPLDGTPFTLLVTSLNNRSHRPFFIHCTNHTVTVETGPEEKVWPKMDETSKVSNKGSIPREPVYNSLGMKMVWIGGGTFSMGSPSFEQGRSIFENPQTRVEIKEGFWMSECEVTRQQYYALMHPKERIVRPHHPLTSISFLRALEFCEELTKHERAKGTLPRSFEYSLPSEAQWEYAARANTETPFWTGKTITTLQANFDGRNPYGNSLPGIFRKDTTPVKSFAPNPFELYDMAGNVAEWTLDVWSPTYEGHPKDGSPRKGRDRRRTVRGGSWREGPASCRSAARRGLDGRDSTFSCQDVGLRLVIVDSQ